VDASLVEEIVAYMTIFNVCDQNWGIEQNEVPNNV